MIEIAVILTMGLLGGEDPAPSPPAELPPLPALPDPPADIDSTVHFTFVDTREKLFRWREKVAGVLRLRWERERDIDRLGETIDRLEASIAGLAPLLSDPSRKDALARTIEKIRGDLADVSETFRQRFEKADRLVEEWLAIEDDLGTLSKALRVPSRTPENVRYLVRSIRQRLDDIVDRIDPAAYQLAPGTGIPRIEAEARRLEPEIDVHAKALLHEKAIEAELDGHRRVVETIFAGLEARIVRFAWDPKDPDPLLEIVLRDPQARVDDDRETRGFRGDSVLRIPEALDRIFRRDGLTRRASIIFEIPVWDDRYGRIDWRASYGSTLRPIERDEFRRFGDVPREDMLRSLGVAIPPREEIPEPPVSPVVEPHLNDLRPKLAATFREVDAEVEGVEVREGALRVTVRDPESDADPQTRESTPPRLACFERCVEAMQRIFEDESPFRSVQFTILGKKVDRQYLQVVDDAYASVVIDRREFVRYNWPAIDAQEGGRVQKLRQMGFRLPPPPRKREDGGSKLPLIIVFLAVAAALGLYLWKRR
ncbi:MAG: hypothetical protein JXP34_22075 [Planctomycetes bacterium]|nr:hypothetical protein [Planctomycetota bacterium]